MNRPPTVGWAPRVLALCLLTVSACSSGPRPLPECHGPSRPVNVFLTDPERRHDDRSRA